MLFCLISCKWVSDGRVLDLGARSFSPQRVTFSISRRTKTSIRLVSYPAFPHNPNLCPVSCLKGYEHWTATLCNPRHPDLFISLSPPHNLIVSTTIARWVKSALSEAGVDISIFGAHSTRGASTSSILLAGSRLEDLMHTADWSQESTFRKFYFWPHSHVFSTIVNQL